MRLFTLILGLLAAGTAYGQAPCHLGCHNFVVAIDDRTDQFGNLDRYAFNVWQGGTVRGAPVPVVAPDAAPEKKTCASMANVQVSSSPGRCAPVGLSCQVTQQCTFTVKCSIKIIDALGGFFPGKVAVGVGSRSAVMPGQNNDVTWQPAHDGLKAGQEVNVNKNASIKCRAGRGWIEVMLVRATWEAVILRVLVVCTQCPDTTGG
jgi:hypothetical protein